MQDDKSPRRRVRGPGLQDVVGRVLSRGGTFGGVYRTTGKAGLCWNGKGIEKSVDVLGDFIV